MPVGVRFRALVLCAVLLMSTIPTRCLYADQQQDVEALLAAGKLEQAVEACRAWAKQEPEALPPHFLLSRVYSRMALWDRAQEELKTVLFLNPACAAAHVSLGDLLRLQGKNDEGKAEYELALKADDKCVGAYAALARMAMAGADPTDATSYLQMGLQVVPASPSLIALEGEVARLTNQPEAAAAKYAEALQKDAKCADALYGLAILAQSRGPDDEAEAQRHWDQFLAAEQDTERAQRVKLGLVTLSVTELESNPFADQRPMLSPDGKWLAFGGYQKLNDQTSWEVYVEPLDGSAPPRPITTGGGSMCPVWMPDSKHILFDFYYPGGKGKQRTFMAALDGNTAPVGLAEDQDFTRNACPIPGTNRLLYNDAWSLWTMNADGSDKQKLPIPCVGEVRFSSVSPDGKTVTYNCINWDDKREGGPPQTLWTAALDGSTKPKQIETGCAQNFYPSFSPDGKKIVFANHGKTLEIFVIPADGSGGRIKLADATRPSWSADGTKLLFDGYAADDPGAIYLMELGGKRLPAAHP